MLLAGTPKNFYINIKKYKYDYDVEFPRKCRPRSQLIRLSAGQLLTSIPAGKINS